MSFDSDLKLARLSAGISTAEAAKRCGVSRRTYVYWEAGKRVPPLVSPPVPPSQAAVLAAIRAQQPIASELGLLLPE